jgi:hypothetical protein
MTRSNSTSRAPRSAHGAANLVITAYGHVPWSGLYTERLRFETALADKIGPAKVALNDLYRSYLPPPNRWFVMRKNL